MSNGGQIESPKEIADLVFYGFPWEVAVVFADQSDITQDIQVRDQGKIRRNDPDVIAVVADKGVLPLKEVFFARKQR